MDAEQIATSLRVVSDPHHLRRTAGGGTAASQLLPAPGVQPPMRPLLVLAALLALAGPAFGSAHPSKAERRAVAKVFRDCGSGRSLRGAKPSTLLLARRTIPADIDEYTDCRDRIRAALKARHYVRPKGRDRVASVLADCRADRTLDHRYPRATLLRARRHLTGSERCRAAIARDLR